MDPISIIYKQINEIARGAVALLPQIAVAIAVIVLTWLVAMGVRALLRRGLDRTSLRQSLKNLFSLLASIGIWILGLMIAAVVVFPNLTPASILAGLGIGSVAIGFAFKDIFENFLAGIIILFRKEMRIGDFIECEGLEGKVENISIRESHIRQTDGQLVVVPNAMLFKNPLTIRTDLDQRRTSIVCGVAYDEDVDKCRDIIRGAVEGCGTVISDNRPVQIFAQEFADSSVNFEVTWWTGSKPVDIRKSRDEVISAVKRALDDSGIEIPFPYRTLTFKESLCLDHAGDERENAGAAVE
ncbi:mechanosensitive ion channel family protein [Oricola cellulosilytica]|uniref:Small-conductance mechanosensitive channel n=1 Tax=Oricola cellulosilytica TaxID=1429082 RepID=A0A4R0P348_9HYPH|nr:mechanosensitive ion channel family protein [Oricola cellulosilytica]TCD11284.1 mechanosensitive ion channel family protein [Oricola cellulosilytica]